VDALSSMRGLSVVSFANVDAVLGPAVKQAIEACTSDACIVEKTSGIKTDGLAIGSLDLEGRRTILRVRLVRSSSAAATVARVSRDVADGGDGLREAVSLAAMDLLPDHAKASVGTLEIAGAMPGAKIVVDGRMSATVPLEATDPSAPAVLSLPPGVHRIKVSAPGHFPATERAQIFAGQRTRLAIDLEKNRSNGPLILGGAGVASVIAGAILGGVVKSKADGWSDACRAGMPCAAGYTRERYESDRASIDRGRTVANALYGVGGAAILAGVIWFFLDPGTDPEVEP
jgi:hypothetical protein